MITIQLNALKVDDQIVLDFVRVMDRYSLRRDDEIEAKLTATDRNYWNKRSSDTILKMVDEALEIINEKASPMQRLNYNKYYIGLDDETRSRNFVIFIPKKQFLHILPEVAEKERWAERFEEEGVSATVKERRVRVTMKPRELEKQRPLLVELLHQAVDEFQR